MSIQQALLRTVTDSHDSVSKDGPDQCDHTQNECHNDKGDVGTIDCSASVSRVLVPLSTLWSAHTRTVVQIKVLRTLTHCMIVNLGITMLVNMKELQCIFLTLGINSLCRVHSYLQLE